MSSAPASRRPATAVRARGRTLDLGAEPWLMGIVNATPDSFSDAGEHPDLDARVALGARLMADGARLLDVGGESAVTNRPPVEAATEIDRVVPLVRRLAGELGALVSIDTYKPAVAEAAIEAGAVMVNDVSGLRDPELADVCARTGAALVVMHTRARPKERLQDPDRYDDVVGDVVAFLRERMEVALEHGVDPEQIVLDPGPDFSKTPAQTIALLRRLDELHALGRPLLLAVSRKDFVGALTGRSPRERLAGTLAALDHGIEQGARILRVHDVREASDFLTVRAALRGHADVARALALADDLRSERPASARPTVPRPDWLDSSLYPFEGRLLEVRGARVHHLDEGDGPVLLLLHGNPTWSFLYRRIVLGLRDSFRCVAVDYPGFGLSEAPRGYGYTPAEHAEVVEGLVEALDLRDVTMMVQDWGGPIGFRVATRMPDRFAAFVIGNTFAWPMTGSFGAQMFSRFLGGPVGRYLILRRNFFVERILPGGMRLHTLSDAEMRAYRGPFPTRESRMPTYVFPREILGSTEWLASLEGDLDRVRDRPALIVWPDRDPAFRAGERRRWEKLLANHRTVELPGASHFIQEEAPDEIVAAIREWWPQAGVRPGR